MYIEDIINLVLYSNIKINPFDLKIISSLYSQIMNGDHLTEKQGNLAVSVLKKYESKISNMVNQNLESYFKNPKFKYGFRVINSTKTISLISHPLYNKAIKVEFPYDELLIQKFRENKQKLDYAQWDKDKKCWILSLDEKSILFIMSLMEDNTYFNCDDEIIELINQVKQIQENIEKFIPMAVLEDDKIKFINVSPNTPQNTSIDLIESILFAKNIGISTWDNHVETRINTLPYDNVLKEFIKHDVNKPFELNLNENSLSSIGPAIKFLFPCLVIISHLRELEKLKKCVEFFNSIDIDNSEMSVLFRLPSDTNAEFNSFVKSNKLNSPISDKIKIFFVGEQLPKTITNIDFNSILNYNYYSAHYKIKSLVSYNKNVINILDHLL